MPNKVILNEEIKQHYKKPELPKTILTALAAAGLDINTLKPDDLSPVDEFHIRGREATRELAIASGINHDKHVLDVGSGIGGPSRHLAHEFGCRVTGIDLTEEYCHVATQLAELVGLNDLVTYRQADALEIPYPENNFDVIWTQHAAMNIPDKKVLYREMYRVLKPGGKLAIYDILAGSTGPVLFPVPWARTPETSFLVTPEQLQILLKDSGFSIREWDDTTTQGTQWFSEIIRKTRESGIPPLGFHILMGQDFRLMAQNQLRNLTEGRIALAQIVAVK